MEKKYQLMVFVFSLFLVTFPIIAYASIQSSIYVTTDRTSYENGDVIFVQGEVTYLEPDVPIILRVIAPNGDLVTVAQIDINSDGSFSTELIVGGPLMGSEGTYTIDVFYGSQSYTTTTFTVDGSIEVAIVPDTDFIVEYMINGGKVLSITPNVYAHSVIIAMAASQDGSLEITLPRALIDAKMGDQDDTFFVLVDGEEVDFEETTISTDRTLTIQFPAGAKEIEIIGTFLNSDSSLLIIPSSTLNPPTSKSTSHTTWISLQVTKGSSADSIQVYPEITYDSGTVLGDYTVEGVSDFIKIYVDNTYKISVSQNQWSNDIDVGYGYHNVYAEFVTFTDYSSGDTYTSATSNTESINLSPPNPPTLSSNQDLTIFIILGVIAVIVGVTVALMKRRKLSTIKSGTKTDDTQIWK